jgi:hypothetical protein
MKAKAKILSVRFVKADDTDPDMSYLGEYADSPDAVSIDRKERGHMGRHEFRYFNLGAGDPEYIEQDYERYESYNRGNWGMVGVYAEACVSIRGVIQTIRSGGLWGVESDSDKSYFDSLKVEELAQLREILTAMRFGRSAIDRAFAKCEDA